MTAPRPTGTSADPPKGWGPAWERPGARPPTLAARRSRADIVWLFDLDNTLHDASHAVFGELHRSMNAYIIDRLGVDETEAGRLRQLYFHRYGATLLGLVRHHGVKAGHFLEETHRHPELESALRTSAHDRAALKRLPGRKFILTNAPRRYALRVLDALKLGGSFDGVISIEDMSMFGDLRPKPDARMLRRIVARLKVRASDCVLVEDMLNNQKAARGIGMRCAWMQRYLGGRYRGASHEGRPPNQGAALGGGRRRAAVRRCPSPSYVRAKIHALEALRKVAPTRF